MTPTATPKPLTLIPFPEQSIPLAWKWLLEFPHCNFDDYGPKTEQEFIAQMTERMENELIVGVTPIGEERQLVGIMAYLPLTPRLGSFHGICFARAVHGTGLPLQAMRQFIADLFGRGKIEKIAASYFADNQRVRAFLKKLGAEDEVVVHGLR